jgi:hypothetical protein
LRVEHAIGSVRLVGQDGVDDQGDKDKPHDRLDVVLTDAGHERVHRRFPLQEQGNATTNSNGHGSVAHYQVGAHAVHQQRRYLRRHTGFDFFCFALSQVTDDQHRRHRDRAQAYDPAAES